MLTRSAFGPGPLKMWTQLDTICYRGLVKSGSSWIAASIVTYKLGLVFGFLPTTCASMIPYLHP